MDAPDDQQLLHVFAESGSEAAFRTLVERHLGLVHASALRQLNDHHLAEDVTQAVFILLAQKAASLTHHQVLAGWLHQTTHFVAQRTRRAEGRRRDREQKAFAMQDSGTTTPEAAWSDLAPVLDQALLQLSDADRHAILLRFLEQRNHREIAIALGLGEEAAKKRVHRALEKLRGFLGQWGVSVSLVTLGTLLSEHGAEATPAHLTRPILDQALQPNPAHPAPPPIAHLVSATLQAWRQASRLRVAGWLVGGIAGLTLVLAPLLPDLLTRLRNPRIPVDQPVADGTFGLVPSPTETASMNITPAAPQDTSQRELLLLVVDAATGQGLPDAEVQVDAMSWENWPGAFSSQRTDSNGAAVVRFRTNTYSLVVGALVPGRTPRCVRFEPHRGDIIPEQYTLRLPPTEQAVGGTLVSPEGQPVANAELQIRFFGILRESGTEYTGTAKTDGIVMGQSGTDGRWTSTWIPRAHPGFQITAHHPDFPPTLVTQVGPGLAPNPGSAQRLDTHQKLWARQLTTTLNRPLQLVGKVTDSLGRPIPKAVLLHSPHNWNQRRAETGDDGRFLWNNLQQGAFAFTAMAPGHGPRHIQAMVDSDSPPADVVLPPSAPLRLRIIDSTGAGVEGVRAIPEAWDGALYFAMNPSGPDGRIEWRDAPANEEFQLYVAKFGWGERRDVAVVADGSEHEIVLGPTPRIHGRVLDAESGRPIAEFQAIPSDRGPQWPEPKWDRSNAQVCRNGDLQLAFVEADPPYRFRIEAEGYLPYVHEPIQPGPFPAHPLEIHLQLADANNAIHGTVLQPKGDPAAGVEVHLIEKADRIRLGRHSLRREGGNPFSTTTDAEGRFRLPSEAAGDWLIAAGEAGFVLAKPPGPGEPATLQLQAWGRIEGRIDLPDRARPDQSVWLDPGHTLTSPLMTFISKAEPDFEGRFVFDSLLPGQYTVSLRIADARPGHHRTPVTVEPGRTTEVRIADPGPRVKGRVVLQGPGGTPVGVAGIAVTFASPNLPPGNLGPFFQQLPPQEAEQRAIEIHRLQLLRSSIVAAFPDSEGRFVTLEGLAPGDYLLGIHHTSLNDRPGQTTPQDDIMRQVHWRYLLTSHPDIAELPITVPAPAEAAEPGAIQDLGDITVTVPPKP
jgi:RNA polymerase sigma factor (sigma-70 family)